MVDGWLRDLRNIANRIRGELLEFLEGTGRPKDAHGAEELGRKADEVACRALLEGLEELGRPVILVCEDVGVKELGPVGPEGPYLLVDPLDGTRNVSRGLEIASISLATCRGPSLEGLEEGLVLEVFSGREFWAISGRGAYCGSEALSVSTTKDLSRALVSVDQSHLSKATPEWAYEVIEAVEAVRQLGSAALELCLLAAGVFDAHVDLRGRIRPTDVAAGLLIAVEAGAVAWVRGSIRPEVALRPDEKLRMLVSNRALFDHLKRILATFLPEGGLVLRRERAQGI